MLDQYLGRIHCTPQYTTLNSVVLAQFNTTAHELFIPRAQNGQGRRTSCHLSRRRRPYPLTDLGDVIGGTLVSRGADN